MSNLELILVIAAAVLLGPVTLVATMNLFFWPRRLWQADISSGQVSVLIPARDEEGNLEACVDSVLAQGAALKEILVYNDGSVDGTQQVLDRLVTTHQDLVRQVPVQSLPEGWVGKSHACARLAGQARGHWMLFLDADARLKPNAITSLVADAQHRNATLLSAWPKIEMKSFYERLLMPLLNFVVFSLFPALISRRRDGASLGLAHGACILAERDTYARLGGHELVRDRLFEDTALARAWRERSEDSQVVDGRGIVSVRMYENLSGIWNGFSKNYYPALGSLISFAIFQLYMTAAFVALPILALVAVAAGAIEPVFMLIAAGSLVPRALIALRFRHPMWSVLLHPFAVVVMVALGMRSWWLSSFGRGVNWKGRSYNAAGLVIGDE